jgi:hypothetical protein
MGFEKIRRPILTPPGTDSTIPGVDTDAFADLTDGPGDMSAAGDKIVKVNAGGTALEYDDPATGGINYSTSEQDTGLTWTDAATVYQKTVAIPAGPNNSQVAVAHGITGLADVVDLAGTIYIGGGTDVGRLLPYAHSTDITQNIELAWDTTNVYLTSGTNGDFSGYAGTYTIRYTKSA